MGLRSLLENPNGGQLFSAYMLLIPSIVLALVIGGNLLLKLSDGEALDVNRDGLGLIASFAMIIPALIKFVRSRHAR